MKPLTLILIAIATVTPGCTVGPNYTPPNVQILTDWAEQGPEPTTQPSPTQPSQLVSRPIPLVEWWTLFKDPLLDDLIQRAVQQNLDLKQATARIREARAQRSVVRADLFPQLNTSAEYQHARVSKNGVASAFGSGSNGTINAGGGTPGTGAGANGNPAIPGAAFSEFDLYQGGFDASWEIDVFGGHRRAVEAATADIQSAIEQRHDVLTTLLAEVARNYLDLRQAQQRLSIARLNLEAQQRTVNLTRELVNQGVINQLDLSRAEAQVATTRAQIPSLEVAASQAIHRLSTLLAQRPTALAQQLNQSQDLPLVPDQVAVGLPSELLRRRPDIRRAERQIAAATARIGVATADLFPKFTLNASAGLQSLEPGSLLDWQSRFYSIGPGISWPIFDAGRIRSGIQVQNARQDQAILNYQQTVLAALKDVEDALVAYTKAQQRTASLQEAAVAEAKSVRIAKDLYARGLTDFLSVLDAQRSLLAAEDSLATAHAEVATTLVTLYKSLGGGWPWDPLQRSPVEPQRD